MKKTTRKVLSAFLMLLFTGLMVIVASDTPCTDMWSACVNKKGYPNQECNDLWDHCMYVMYGQKSA